MTAGFLVIVAMQFGASRCDSLSPQDAKSRLDRDPTITLVDVRFPMEYRGGHIKGALLAPFTEVRSSAVAYLPRDSEIILYCTNGPRGAYACNVLHQMGFKRVLNMTGGIESWRSQGFLVEK